MAEETIRTRHPAARAAGASRRASEAVRKAMLSALRGRELTHTELMRSLAGKLKGDSTGTFTGMERR